MFPMRTGFQGHYDVVDNANDDNILMLTEAWGKRRLYQYQVTQEYNRSWTLVLLPLPNRKREQDLTRSLARRPESGHIPPAHGWPAVALMAPKPAAQVLWT